MSAGVGHMVRVPDASERYFGLRRAGSDWVGNPLLKPAKNTGLDSRVSFRRNSLLISSGFYFYAIRDFITVIPGKKVNPIAGIMNVNARSYANAGARILGQEVELVYALSRRLFINGNVSNVLGRHDALPARGLPSGYLVEMPPLSSRASVRYDTGSYWFELEGIAVARQHRVDNILQEAPTPGHGIANLRAGMTLRRLALRIGLNNVFDRSYFEHLSYQRDPFRTGARVFEPGRNVYVNLSFRY